MCYWNAPATYFVEKAWKGIFTIVVTIVTVMATLLALDALTRFAGKLWFVATVCNCHLEWYQSISTVSTKQVRTSVTLIHLCWCYMCCWNAPATYFVEKAWKGIFTIAVTIVTVMATLLALDSLTRFAGKLLFVATVCNCHLEWYQSISTVSTKQVRTSVTLIHLCLLLRQESVFWNNKSWLHLPIWDRAAWHLSLQRPARTRRCWFNLLIGLLSAKHHVEHFGMTDPHGENPGAVSILHGDGKSNHLANGVGSDGGELCSVTLITLSHITKSADRLQTSPTDIAGTVRKLRKCCIASTSWIPSVRKCQLCVHIFHLTHCDSQASFFACGMRSIYITNAYVWRRLQRTLLGHLAVFLSAA